MASARTKGTPLAVDTVAFAALIGERVKPDEVRRVLERINQELDRGLKRRNRRFSSVVGALPQARSETGAADTIVAAVTPYLLPTGAPQAPASQKRETLLMANLTLTEAHTGRTLAVREFYTGYSITSSAVSP